MENGLIPQEILAIYDDYLRDTIHLEETRKPTDGLLGFGRRADSDPCHDRFAERLEQALNDLSATEPSSATACAVMNYIFSAPQMHKDNRQAYWMLLAVHGQTDRLIRFLSKEDAAGLSAWYNDTYPKHVLLPVQKTLSAHLRSQSGDRLVQKKKGLVDFFRGAVK